MTRGTKRTQISGSGWRRRHVDGWVVRAVERDDHLPPKRYESGLVLTVDGAFHVLDNEVRGYGTRNFPAYEHSVAPDPIEMPVEPRLIAELGSRARRQRARLVRYRPAGDGADPAVHGAHRRRPALQQRGRRVRQPAAGGGRRRRGRRAAGEVASRTLINALVARRQVPAGRTRSRMPSRPASPAATRRSASSPRCRPRDGRDEHDGHRRRARRRRVRGGQRRRLAHLSAQGRRADPAHPRRLLGAAHDRQRRAQRPKRRATIRSARSSSPPSTASPIAARR